MRRGAVEVPRRNSDCRPLILGLIMHRDQGGSKEPAKLPSVLAEFLVLVAVVGIKPGDSAALDSTHYRNRYNYLMKKRDAAYYQRRLRAEHPSVYADLKAGRILSTRQAAAKAGLVHLPTRLSGLKREWKGATNDERREFGKWMKRRFTSGTKPAPKAPKDPLLDADGYLALGCRSRLGTEAQPAANERADVRADGPQGL